MAVPILPEALAGLKLIEPRAELLTVKEELVPPISAPELAYK